jgi:hypothetical protein
MNFIYSNCDKFKKKEKDIGKQQEMCFSYQVLKLTSWHGAIKQSLECVAHSQFITQSRPPNLSATNLRVSSATDLPHGTASSEGALSLKGSELSD